jgi:hypothetical protein
MSISRLTLLVLVSIFATSVQAETINCTPITSVPVTITAQGLYCLTGNVATSQTTGNAITINANNVTLDLNGWKVGGQGAGLGTQAYGIVSNANNVTIKNGIVRGFYWGIDLTGNGAVVQDLLVDSNIYVGITADGLGALVEHNQVVNTGSDAIFAAFAIDAEGQNATINNNTVVGLTVQSGGYEYGILMYNSATAKNNMISNTALASGVSSYGIYEDHSIATNNTVSNFSYGIYIYTAGIYSFNTIYGCTNDFTGGTAGSANSGT